MRADTLQDRTEALVDRIAIDHDEDARQYRQATGVRALFTLASGVAFFAGIVYRNQWTMAFGFLGAAYSFWWSAVVAPEWRSRLDLKFRRFLEYREARDEHG